MPEPMHDADAEIAALIVSKIQLLDMSRMAFADAVMAQDYEQALVVLTAIAELTTALTQAVITLKITTAIHNALRGHGGDTA